MDAKEEKRTTKIDLAFRRMMHRFGEEHVLSVQDVIIQLCGYAAMVATRVGMPREHFEVYVKTAWEVAERAELARANKA